MNVLGLISQLIIIETLRLTYTFENIKDVALLRENDTSRVLKNLNAQEKIKFAKILHSKVRTELVKKIINSRGLGTGDDNVIDINQNIHSK
jgi:hypothetical protein